MMRLLQINGGQQGQVVASCRSFRVINPSIGATYQIDDGQKIQLGSDSVHLTPSQTAVVDGGHELYPYVQFNPGPNVPLTVIVDADDGIDLKVDFDSPLSPGSQAGDIPPNSGAGNTTTPGLVGTPSLILNQGTGGLILPTAQSGAFGVSANVNENFSQFDNQIFDATAGAGAAIDTGVLGTPGVMWRDLLVRVSGLTAPTARTLTMNGVRLDASQVPIWGTGTTGITAAITDVEVALGMGANIPSTPLGSSVATCLGFNFAGPLPEEFRFILSAAGADTPRMTIWARGGA